MPLTDIVFENGQAVSLIPQGASPPTVFYDLTLIETLAQLNDSINSVSVDLGDGSNLTAIPNLDVPVSSRSSHGPPDLSRLDVPVSSRSSHPAPDLSLLDVAVSTRSSHGAPDLSNLDVPVSSRSSHSAPNLSFLDVPVSSRSSHPAPDLSGIDIGTGSTLTEIPWNPAWDTPTSTQVGNALAFYATAKVGDPMTLQAGAVGHTQLSDAAVAKIEAALLNEGDGQPLIDAIAQAVGGATIDTNLIATMTRDAILDRTLLGNHDSPGTLGHTVQRLDVTVSSRSSHGPPNLANLDVPVSSRSSHGEPDLSRLDVPVSSRSSHGAPDLSNLDVPVSSRSSHAAPNLANLDVPVSSRSSHPEPNLSRLDVPVSSRSSHGPPDLTSLGLILTNTNVLKQEWSDGGRLDNLLDSKSVTGDEMGLSDAGVVKLEAALLNEGDGQALIDAIVQSIGTVDIDTGVLSVLIRDTILDRAIEGNHELAGSLGDLLKRILDKASIRESKAV